MCSELTPQILRLVHDKFEKDLIPVEETKIECSERLISEVYIYIKKQLDAFSEEIINERVLGETIHDDLRESFTLNRLESNYFFKEFMNDDPIERNLKLCFEYESLDMKIMAEKRYKDILLEHPDNHDVWYKYCLFKLRDMDYIGAEEALWRALELEETSIQYRTLLCCFYVRRGRVGQARTILEDILSKDRTSVLHNTFMALLYIYYLERPKLGKKFFNVSQRAMMRNLGRLPNRTEKVDPKMMEKHPTDLSEDEQDEIWMGLITLFSNNYFVKLTHQAIQQLKNQETYQVNQIYAALEFLKKDYEKSDQYLDKILEKNENDGDILLQKALNSFMRERYYESEEYIFKALRAEPSLCNFATLLRLGYIYIKRESIEDANIILSKACNLNPKSALSWLGLAIASLKLGYLQEAEKSLKMANILDPINADVWGYSILLGLKDERKFDQSINILSKYLALEIEDLVILNKIAESLMNINKNEEALQCFLRIDSTYEDLKHLTSNSSLEISKVYWLIGQLNHELKHYEDAIKYYDLASDLIEGDFNKGMIRDMREEAINRKSHLFEDAVEDASLRDAEQEAGGSEHYYSRDYE